MMQSAMPFLPPERDDARMKEYDADLTPTPVVRQLFNCLTEEGLILDFQDYLDPSAGAGVFGLVASEYAKRELAIFHAFEPRTEEKEHLRTRYDLVWPHEFNRSPLGTSHRLDLIATNPPFKDKRQFVEDGLRLLKPRGVMSLLLLNDAFQRKQDGHEWLEAHRPTRVWPIGGPIDFRGGRLNPDTGKPYGSDSRSYSWFIWERDLMLRSGDRWDTKGETWLPTLPTLPSEDRKWRGVEPGREAA